jgi:uncharacterized protein
LNNALKNTAILVFSRTAQAEATEKKLLFSTQKAESVAALMIEYTRNIVQNSGLPYYFITEKQQIGSDFGKKLSNAFESVFLKGYENVIAIGNDCLTLTSNQLIHAAELLVDTPSVLGPTSDGGVYLMGFQKESFSKEAFSSIDWQTENAFSQLSLLNENIKILPILSDIDTAQDLTEQLNSINIRLKKAILSIIIEIAHCFQKPISIFVLKIYLSLKSLRAPPAFSRFS